MGLDAYGSGIETYRVSARKGCLGCNSLHRAIYGKSKFTILVISVDSNTELHKSKLGLWGITSVPTPGMDTGKELRRNSKYPHSRTLVLFYHT
jgi:hypothetical protein